MEIHAESTSGEEAGLLARVRQKVGTKIMDVLGIKPCPTNEELSAREHEQIVSRFITDAHED